MLDEKIIMLDRTFEYKFLCVFSYTDIYLVDFESIE